MIFSLIMNVPTVMTSIPIGKRRKRKTDERHHFHDRTLEYHRERHDTQEETLRETFEVFGEVSSVKIIIDKFSGRSKGFGFVEMPVEEEGSAAINELNETEIDGRTIVVKKANPRNENNRYNRSDDYNR